jgi:hypothetical protein
MRTREEYEFATRMIGWGMNDSSIARLTGIRRATIRSWRLAPTVRASSRRSRCPICGDGELTEDRYAYLLGMYLGDGCISPCPRNVFKLRIVLDQRYPQIIEETTQAIQHLRTGQTMKVGQVAKIGCVELYSYWKHWPCVFPQHGDGPKHLRRIALAVWQESIVNRYPHLLLRGLIHSDGWRGMNLIRRPLKCGVKAYAYPMYQFDNNSRDIQAIFCAACETLGISWRQMTERTVAVSRREDVARLDEVIGPKR